MDTLQSLNDAVGKVFAHPVTGEQYGPIRLGGSKKIFSRLDGNRLKILAEDSSGNYFTTTDDGIVSFWDHETDDLIPLASSMSDFLEHCAAPDNVKLAPDQLKSVWIDPAFAKSLGKEVPHDGWVKKRSKGH